jgi:hypothetical protein
MMASPAQLAGYLNALLEASILLQAKAKHPNSEIHPHWVLLKETPESKNMLLP